MAGWSVCTAGARAAAAAADAALPLAPTPLMSLVSSVYRPTANATASAFLSRIDRSMCDNQRVPDGPDGPDRAGPGRPLGGWAQAVCAGGTGGTGGADVVCGTVPSDGIRIQSSG